PYTPLFRSVAEPATWRPVADGCAGVFRDADLSPERAAIGMGRYAGAARPVHPPGCRRARRAWTGLFSAGGLPQSEDGGGNHCSERPDLHSDWIAWGVCAHLARSSELLRASRPGLRCNRRASPRHRLPLVSLAAAIDAQPLSPVAHRPVAMERSLNRLLPPQFSDSPAACSLRAQRP